MVIEVRIGTDTIGYLTPKMTERHAEVVEECAAQGKRATLAASSIRGTKGTIELWRVKAVVAD